MACDFPIKAYRSEDLSPAGKRLLTFNPLRAVNSSSPMLIPCNNCTGCRLERSRQWAVRMMHESKMYDCNSFLTLTYDDQHVPQSYGLELRDLQLFLKRLRKFSPNKIRFYASGEYGDLLGRPHFHAAIFNYDPDDRVYFGTSEQGEKLYLSEKMDKVWQQGRVYVGDLTFQSAGYIARYAMKKVNGEKAADHYYRISPIDGQAYLVRPEFAVMSRRPGIGATWLEKFKSDIYPSGFIVVNGVPQAPPRYYTSKLQEEEQTRLKRQARRRSLKHKAHNTTERRWAKVAVRDDRIKNLKRKFEG